MDTEYSKYEPIFGAWKIRNLIGEGSYGKVYEIEREDFGVTYKAALKAITIPRNKSDIKSVMSDGMDEKSASTYFRGFVEEMTKEFAIMDKLKGNSYIVNYEDHIVIEHKDEIGWDVLIRMELLTPLNDYLENHKLSKNEVVQFGIDLCKALEICGKYDIIHRDIKPENIFVSDLGTFKLGDFGIARVAEKTTGASTKVGTVAYMAPEVLRGEKYSKNVDIYSLGLVLFRLLNNNRLPFLPPAPEQITYTIREEANARRYKGEALPAPSQADAELSSIILKATAFDPSKRYQNASQMREDLERYLGRTGQIMGSEPDDTEKTVLLTPQIPQPVMQQQAAAQPKPAAMPQPVVSPQPAAMPQPVVSPRPAMPANGAPGNTQTPKKRSHLGLIIGIVCAVAAVVFITILTVVIINNNKSDYEKSLARSKKQERLSTDDDDDDEDVDDEDYEEGGESFVGEEMTEEIVEENGVVFVNAVDFSMEKTIPLESFDDGLKPATVYYDSDIIYTGDSVDLYFLHGSEKPDVSDFVYSADLYLYSANPDIISFRNNSSDSGVLLQAKNPGIATIYITDGEYGTYGKLRVVGPDDFATSSLDSLNGSDAYDLLIENRLTNRPTMQFDPGGQGLALIDITTFFEMEGLSNAAEEFRQGLGRCYMYSPGGFIEISCQISQEENPRLIVLAQDYTDKAHNGDITVILMDDNSEKIYTVLKIPFSVCGLSEGWYTADDQCRFILFEDGTCLLYQDMNTDTGIYEHIFNGTYTVLADGSGYEFDLIGTGGYRDTSFSAVRDGSDKIYVTGGIFNSKEFILKE